MDYTGRIVPSERYPTFGLNRFNWRSVDEFVADVKLAEDLGYGYALSPSNPLAIRDPYVVLAAAARETSTIRLGLLIDNAVLSHPAVTAGSIATLDEVSDGRALLVYGVGDTAVRWLGQQPASVRKLEESTILIRRLLAGEKVEVGAERPARLFHARPAPVWIAAGGPRTLRMAGRVADGVFLRVGRHPDNLRAAFDAVRAGALEAGRDPDALGIGLVFHVITPDEQAAAHSISRAMAAGFYEYSPALFEIPKLAWDGPPVQELKKQVWPDFHHAADLKHAGRVVDFLSEEAAQSFSLFGSAADIAQQLRQVLEQAPRVDIIVPHPVPMPGPGATFKTWFAREVIPRL